MPADKGEAREFNLRQIFPWIAIFRAFGIALDPSKLLLATGAVVLMWFGWFLLALIFQQNPDEYGQWPGDAPRGANPFVVLTERPGSIFTSDFWLGAAAASKQAAEPPASVAAKDAEKPAGTDATVVLQETPRPAAALSTSVDTTVIRQPPVHLEPFYKFIHPLLELFKSTPGQGRWWYLLLGVLLTVAVWGLFGGAITRIAALQFARNEKIGMAEALKFSASKFVQFVTAPLIPFAAMAVIVIIMFIGGLIVNIPWFGDLVASLLWVLPLLGALAIAIALLGYVGWPLMYATISAEGSDNFDALSRSYVYVFSKPLHYLWYMAVAVVFGIVVTFFVVFFTSMTVYLARWGVALANWRGDPDPMQTLFLYAPSSYDWDRLLIVGREHELENLNRPQFDAMRESIRNNMGFFPTMSAGIMAFWLHLIFLLMLGFAYSFFWSASTIIYFLLRKRVDDTEMDEVFMDEDDDMMSLPPVTPMSPAAAVTLPMAEAPMPSPSEPAKTGGSSAGDGATTT